MENATRHDRPLQIAEGIHWVGFRDAGSGLQCNPYLIVDGSEAVVIDSGSRPDFPTVMMKILQTGIEPSAIGALVYQHYDPDLCGSIPNFEDVIDRQDLKIITHRANIMFIRHYYVNSRLVALDQIGNEYTFSSGRKLTFTAIPYAHAAGNFVTFDEKSGVLFTSDLFGSTSSGYELEMNVSEQCWDCDTFERSCPNGAKDCPLAKLLAFHRHIMPSNKALRTALSRIAQLPFRKIAPQHGHLIERPQDIALAFHRLFSLDRVGIDGLPDLSDLEVDAIRSRFPQPRNFDAGEKR